MNERALTPHGEQLLAILRQQRGLWLTRRQLAANIGKRKLNPYNVTILDALHQRGLIERSHRPNTTPIGYEWVYRVSAPVQT